MTRTALLAAVIVLAGAGAGTAQAAGPGDVILTGGLPLPAGAIPGGSSGYGDDEATRTGASADGRYVVFASDADTLSPAAHADVTNIFRKDRVTGEVILISRATGAAGAAPERRATAPAISDDGGRVAWMTAAALDPADTDGREDVYVRDVATATTMLATPGTTDDPWGYDLSGNGAYVAFHTLNALAGAADGNGALDVYRRTLDGGALTLVSRQAGTANAANDDSYDPAVSDDGRWVAFASQSTNVAAGFVNGAGANDVFVRDMTAGTQYLVSNQGGAALTGGNGGSDSPVIAGTPAAALGGVYVGYTSSATNLAAGGVDPSTAESVYRRRLSENVSVLISRATGAGGANADSRAHVGGISDDASRVVFSSDATNLGAGDDYYGVYVRDVMAATTVLGSADNAYAVQPAISDDGAVIAWVNGQGGITPDSDPDVTGVFARAGGGPTEFVSRPPGNAPFLATATEVDMPNSGARTISADGRYVVFAGTSTRLPGNAAGLPRVYRRDLVTGALELVSRANGPEGAVANRLSDQATISADGSRVAFRTAARLDGADVDDHQSVYVRDLAAQTTTLASRADGAGAPADANASNARIAAGGQHVAFVSAAGNLGVPGGTSHAFLRNLATGETQLVDRATGADGTIGNATVDNVSVSGDGRQVAFTSAATTLHPDDPAPDVDVYVRDTVARTTLLASRRSGLDGTKAVMPSGNVAISADGTVIAFEALDQALAPEAGAWGSAQIVARRLATGENTLVSRAPGGPAALGGASEASLSGDGATIAFTSVATNLVAGLGGTPRRAVFARAMATGALSAPPAFGLVHNEPQNFAINPSISDDGRCLAFQARGHNAFTGTAGDVNTSYVYVLAGGCPSAQPSTQPPGTPPVAQPARPGISRASMLRKRFRVGKRATAKRAALARRAKAGTAFRFDLSATADVTITIQRRAAGRRAGGKCRKPSRTLRKRPACVRYVKRGALVRSGLTAQRHRVAFSGRIGRKALMPGRYRAVLVARNAAGRSVPARLAFRVVRR